MGYMQHHAIVVTAIEGYIAKAHAKALEIFNAEDILGNVVAPVSPILMPAINGYSSFLIAPDGSKLGWDASDRGDRARAEYVAWLDAQAFSDQSSMFDWVEVQYGDDEGRTMIINDSDAWKRD